jgi:hypothetical protein
MLPPGEFTNMGSFMAHRGMLCILTKACDMKEYEALELKSTVAEMELTLNISIISGAS